MHFYVTKVTISIYYTKENPINNCTNYATTYIAHKTFTFTLSIG